MTKKGVCMWYSEYYYKEVLTDPHCHDRNNFCYLVHGIVNWNNYRGCDSVYGDFIEKKIELIKSPDKFYRASLVGKLTKESAKEKIGYPGEVCQLGTFGNYGFIIEPPWDEDVLQIAWNCDLGSPWEQKELKEWVKRHKGKIKGAICLLTQTVGSEDIKYNELILRGHPDTNISGVFYRPYPNAERNARVVARYLEERIGKDVPLVEIPLPPIKPPKGELERMVEVLRGQSEVLITRSKFFEECVESRQVLYPGYSPKSLIHISNIPPCGEENEKISSLFPPALEMKEKEIINKLIDSWYKNK